VKSKRFTVFPLPIAGKTSNKKQRHEENKKKYAIIFAIFGVI